MERAQTHSDACRYVAPRIAVVGCQQVECGRCPEIGNQYGDAVAGYGTCSYGGGYAVGTEGFGRCVFDGDGQFGGSV